MQILEKCREGPQSIDFRGSGVTERFGALRNILLGGPFAFSLFPNGRSTVLDQRDRSKMVKKQLQTAKNAN